MLGHSVYDKHNYPQYNWTGDEGDRVASYIVSCFKVVCVHDVNNVQPLIENRGSVGGLAVWLVVV